MEKSIRPEFRRLGSTIKTYYVDKEHKAIADLVKPGELTSDWTITRINVPIIHRGKGIGSKLLEQILNDADDEGVNLQLEVQSSGDMDNEQLENWYRRYGFMLTVNGYMIRIANK